MTIRTRPESTTTDNRSQEIQIRRAVVTLGLLGIALIHLIDLPSKLSEAPVIGAAYMVLIVAAVVVAEALVRQASRPAWSAAAGLAAATILSYVASRTTGLPSHGGGNDVGNWSESLGVASLFVEGAVVVVSVSALLRHR